ncbi:MAG TPA: S24/S26 family peptidase [Nocardioides sp.]|nr:S24/S26 family peptidase [Nocardioides sp.]
MTGPARIAARSTRGVGRVLLWAGALLGLACLVGAGAAVVLGLRPMVVQSGSMGGAMPAGSLALAEQVPASAVHRGDVVSALDGDGQRITHRVVASAPAATRPGSGQHLVALTLKGDANASADPTPYVVGRVDRVVADLPYAGYLVAWSSGRLAITALGVMASLVGLSVVWGRREPPSPRRRGGTHRTARAGRRLPGRAARRGVAVGAVVLAVVGSWWSPSSRPTGTAASFSDSAALTASAVTPLLPGPTGAVGCANGAAFSGTITVSWTAVAGQTSRYRYRVEVYTTGIGTPLVRSYTLSTNSLVLQYGDLYPNSYLWVGNDKVVVYASLDSGSWRSTGDINRTIWVGGLGDFRCAF